MSMSAQTQPQQQPVVVYPNTVSGQPPPESHSHSNGSFGTVFIVLAVIIVMSAIACCLGRLCNKRQGNKHSKQQIPSKKSQQNPNFRPKERGREREGDLEFGFDKGFPTSKPGGNGDGRGPNKPNFPESNGGYVKNGGGGGDGESYVIDGSHLKPGP